jgi:predicted protein tyrosine phosphatase
MASSVGRPVRVLFVCHYNRKRSATAERVLGKDPQLDVRSAGTSEDALVRVNERMLDWADVIFALDDEQRRALSRLFPEHAALPRVISLEIADEYHFLDPQLVTLLRERSAPYIERAKKAVHG